MHALISVALLALSMSPATAVIAQETESIPRSEVAPRLLHLPIHSIDGQHIGVVTQAAIGGGEAVFIGEVERPLGLGPERIAISADMFIDRGDHIQLTLTADQIREQLGK
jgi:hypothetical protein